MDKLLDRIIADFCLYAEGYTVGINEQVKHTYKKQAEVLHTILQFAGLNLNYQYTPTQLNQIRDAGRKLDYLIT